MFTPPPPAQLTHHPCTRSNRYWSRFLAALSVLFISSATIGQQDSIVQIADSTTASNIYSTFLQSPSYAAWDAEVLGEYRTPGQPFRTFRTLNGRQGFMTHVFSTADHARLVLFVNDPQVAFPCLVLDAARYKALSGDHFEASFDLYTPNGQLLASMRRIEIEQEFGSLWFWGDLDPCQQTVMFTLGSVVVTTIFMGPAALATVPSHLMGMAAGLALNDCW